MPANEKPRSDRTISPALMAARLAQAGALRQTFSIVTSILAQRLARIERHGGSERRIARARLTVEHVQAVFEALGHVRDEYRAALAEIPPEPDPPD
jgi:tRNA G37 N-methylase Trm5